MGRTALIGSNGQLGYDIVRAWPRSALAQSGSELVSLTHAEIDVTDIDGVRSVFGGVRPDLVINTAAYHRVDDCETTPAEAFRVNALGVKNLAEVCREMGARLVHFSTDYVFSGESKRPYQEDDAANPLSAYGISKLAGEHFLRYILPEDHVIVRSSGLYGLVGASGKGGNFIESVLRIAREGQPLRVVNDQVSCPTYTADLARVVLEVLARGGRGTYHLTNAGQCSWYDFAGALFDMLGLKPDLQPTTSAEYNAAAKRPAYSVLANSRLKELDIVQPRPWQEALGDYLILRGHISAV